MMPTLEDDFFSNPVGMLGTVHARPWQASGRIALLGDAAHAIVPFFGQGMNCAFEDCTVLNSCIDEFEGDWSRVLPAYEARRKANADAIAALAIENFVEMRDAVADERFLAKKQLERLLEERYPERFVPRYTMVTFTRFPYTVARQRGEIQDALLEELLGPGHDASAVDLDAAGTLLRSRLAPIDSIHI
jgi:kynurenine 3-monooxygenase